MNIGNILLGLGKGILSWATFGLFDKLIALILKNVSPEKIIVVAVDESLKALNRNIEMIDDKVIDKMKAKFPTTAKEMEDKLVVAVNEAKIKAASRFDDLIRIIRDQK